jgi:serine/threonine protein kinase
LRDGTPLSDLALAETRASESAIPRTAAPVSGARMGTDPTALPASAANPPTPASDEQITTPEPSNGPVARPLSAPATPNPNDIDTFDPAAEDGAEPHVATRVGGNPPRPRTHQVAALAEPVVERLPGTPSVEIGTAIGEYSVTELIGEGGMGVVYGGVHPIIGKKVAIKVLRLEFAARTDVVARFIAEARAVNAIGSRHIVNIFSFGQLPDGRHYYVMDRLNGRPLTAYLRSAARDLATMQPLLEDVLLGLAAAHGKKIIHRDLKPDNIFVIEEPGVRPTAVLLDFGIAKLLSPDIGGSNTHTGTVMGTPHYMAPEQFRSANVDARADLYAMGVIFYQIFSGRVPFSADSYIDLVNMHLSTPPARPAAFDRIPPRLERLIMRLLSKAAHERPSSAEQVLTELQAIGRGESATEDRPERPAGVAIPWRMIAAGLGLAVLTAVTVVVLRNSGTAAVTTPPVPTPPVTAPVEPVKTAPPTRPSADTPTPPALPRAGVVIVHTTPSGQVTVDGAPAGEGTEVHATGLAPGHHVVAVTRKGFEPFERDIEIEPGSQKLVSVVLHETKASAEHRAHTSPGRAPDTRTHKPKRTNEDDDATMNPF